MPDGMTIQGYEGSDAQVFSEEEVNRRRATSGRKRLFPTAPGPRTPVTPAHDEEDPRRALCSNADLLDALDADRDAAAILDRYQVPQRPDVVTDDANVGRGELDVDDILEALARHHDDARAVRPDAALPRGTADLAPTIPTTRPRRHRATSVDSRRPSSPRRRAAAATAGLLIIVGLGAWTTLTIAGPHHRALRPDHPPRIATALTGAGDTQQSAAVAERLVADRARSTGIVLARAGNRARAAAAAQQRDRRAETRRRRLTHTRTVTNHPDAAAASTGQTVQMPGDGAPTVTSPQVAAGEQTPAQNTAAPQTNQPASSHAPAFGQDGTLGPGHSPDS
jgi:hypothetical protein